MSEDLELLVVLNERIAAKNSIMGGLSAGDEAVSWLSSLSAIGEFLSVLIRRDVDNIERFKSVKKFTGYTGLAPSRYASGNRTAHGKLAERGK